ncbi:MAG: DUF1330 domain-containing protein [Rhizobiales bacterium]|nr:DUF1330 domain-containing protein [Hyphomicrobiales bacterium]
MVAYVIVDTKIHDVEAYEGYKKLARPIVEKFGGQYRVRGGDMEIVENELWEPTRIVVLEFKDMAAAKAMLSAEEYIPVKAIRNAAAKCSTIIIDGV